VEDGKPFGIGVIREDWKDPTSVARIRKTFTNLSRSSRPIVGFGKQIVCRSALITLPNLGKPEQIKARKWPMEPVDFRPLLPMGHTFFHIHALHSSA
jgi:hypothetical protein